MIRIVALIRLGRPLFLAGGFVLHSLGVAMAIYAGAPINPYALLWGQIAITSIQLMTHYSNEYFDLAADTVNTTPTFWSGGSRVLPRGLLPPGVALAVGLFFGSIGLIAALILTLVVQTGVLTLPLILLALALAWEYSGPPIRMHSRGLGELTGTVLVAGMTPTVGFYLQTGQLELLPVLAVIPLCCIQFNMLLAVAWPDVEGDRIAGKCTLSVLLGRMATRRLYGLLLSLAYGLVPVLVALGLPASVGQSILAGSPLALWLGWRVLRGDWSHARRSTSIIFWTIGLLMGTALLETLSFALIALS